MLAALHADRLRVAELQKQILQLEHSLSELRIQQSQTQERLYSYKYPVLTLPNEIMSEIFLQFLPPYPHFPPLAGLSSPTILTQICRQWREIALATPELWGVISSLDEYDAEWEAQMFRLWLERSRCCPLRLRLGTDQTWASDKFVEIVVPHRARWQHLKIDLGNEGVDSCIFGSPMPLLRHLELMVEDASPDMVDDASPYIIAFHEAPLLSTVALNDSATLRILLPWAQLRSLTLLGVLPSHCFPILVQTPSLLHCELRVCFEASGDPEIGTDITLARLKSLVLADLGAKPLTDLLATLIVPALRSLRIPQHLLAPNPIDSLTAFISKSRCTPEELDLTGRTLMPRKSYRQAFPSLKLSFGSSMTDGEDSSDSDSLDA
ncbi:hypothetical protein DFH06DRAFT_1338054 [Mycena polygramma]|nr:hypothetical protein DFH06DRAFT_1338054 [Mycena polygramma]